MAFFSQRFHQQALLLLSGFAIAAAFGCGGKKSEMPQRAGGTMEAEGYVVKEEPLATTYQSSGTLLPNEEVNVYAETTGRVTKIYFREGNRVRKNTLLVQLFDGELQASLQKLKAQKELQLTTQKRQEELLEIHGISRQEVDITRTQIASIEADIALVEAQLRKLKIYAPFDGIVGLRNISEGAIVSPTTLITTIEQVNPLKLDFSIPERYAKQVHPNMQVSFSVAGVRDTQSAKVVAVQPSANASTRTITIRALVSNASNNLTSGSFANVQIPLSENEAAITIPSKAIIPTTRESKVAVLKNGKAQLIPVRTGVRLSAKVEILDGLSAGDTVITTGMMQIREGMDIAIKKLTDPANPSAD